MSDQDTTPTQDAPVEATPTEETKPVEATTEATATPAEK